MGKLQATGRAFWSGTLSFGLVSIPVEFVAARRRSRVGMKMVTAKGESLSRMFHAGDDDAPLETSEITRGYEIEEGQYVPVTDEELEALAPEKTRDIDLKTFVPREQLSPAYFEQSYYLIPGAGSAKAYHLLASVMEKTGRVGIASFVMRDKEHLVAILPEHGLLTAETMRFADELRDTSELGIPKKAKPAAADVKRFAKALAALEQDHLPVEELVDEDSRQLAKLAQAKAKRGEGVVKGAGDEGADAGGDVIDLMQLLKQRLGAGTTVKPSSRLVVARRKPAVAAKRARAAAPARKKTPARGKPSSSRGRSRARKA